MATLIRDLATDCREAWFKARLTCRIACVQGKVNWPNAKWSGGTMAELGQIFATNWVAAIQRGLRKNGENTSVMLPRGGKQHLT